MTRRAEFRNEVKTRLRDEVYEKMQTFKQLHYIDSDSAALARLVEMMLCGVVGNVPGQPAGVSANLAQLGTRV